MDARNLTNSPRAPEEPRFVLVPFWIVPSGLLFLQKCNQCLLFQVVQTRTLAKPPRPETLKMTKQEDCVTTDGSLEGTVGELSFAVLEVAERTRNLRRQSKWLPRVLPLFWTPEVGQAALRCLQLAACLQQAVSTGRSSTCSTIARACRHIEAVDASIPGNQPLGCESALLTGKALRGLP